MFKNSQLPSRLFKLLHQSFIDTVEYQFVLGRGLAPQAKKSEFLHLLNCTFILNVIQISYYPL